MNVIFFLFQKNKGENRKRSSYFLIEAGTQLLAAAEMKEQKIPHCDWIAERI